MLKLNSCNTKILTNISTYLIIGYIITKSFSCSNGYNCNTLSLHSKALKDKNFPHPEVILFFL